MPYVTKFEKFTDGQTSWMEPVQVWVPLTDEQIEANRLHAEEGERLTKETIQLIADIGKVLEGTEYASDYPRVTPVV